MLVCVVIENELRVPYSRSRDFKPKNIRENWISLHRSTSIIPESFDVLSWTIWNDRSSAGIWERVLNLQILRLLLIKLWNTIYCKCVSNFNITIWVLDFFSLTNSNVKTHLLDNHWVQINIHFCSNRVLETRRSQHRAYSVTHMGGFREFNAVVTPHNKPNSI